MSPEDPQDGELDALTLRATPERLRVAGEAAGLTSDAIARGLSLAVRTPAPAEWRRFLSVTLAGFGAGLLLAGAVSFIAYNWERIGRYGKFALVELAIVGATLLAWRKLPRLSGQVALLSASVLVGPLLALYGQTYQTGADPWGLFLSWCVLIVPWAIAARFGANWLLVLLLLDVSWGLYYAQVLTPRTSREAIDFPLGIAAFHALAVVLWELQMRRRPPVIPEPWAVRVMASIGLVAQFFPAMYFVMDNADAGGRGVVALAAFAASVAIMLRHYARGRRDRYMVTLAGAAGMAMVTVIVARLVFDVLDVGEIGLFLMAAFVVWQITYGVRLYRRTRAS